MTRYLVRDKFTLEILASYTDAAQCYADWFIREGNLWVPRQPVTVTQEGSVADQILQWRKDRHSGQGVGE